MFKLLGNATTQQGQRQDKEVEQLKRSMQFLGRNISGVTVPEQFLG